MWLIIFRYNYGGDAYMKKLKIIAIILGVIIAILALLAWWQFDNLKVLYYYFNYDKDELSGMISTSQNDVKNHLKKENEYNIKPTDVLEEELHKRGVITDKELASLVKGKITLDDLFLKEVYLYGDHNVRDKETGEFLSAEELINEYRRHQKDTNESNPVDKNGEVVKEPPKTQENVNKTDHSEEISQCIADMYVLKSEFVSRLDAIFSEASTYYKSASDSEKESTKSNLIKIYYPKVSALESECDKKVDDVVSKLKKYLAEDGKDSSLVDKIYEAYENEKTLKKAYYMNKI